MTASPSCWTCTKVRISFIRARPAFFRSEYCLSATLMAKLSPAVVEKLGDVVEIDAAALVEHDGERVSCRGDGGCRRRRDHAL